MPITIRYSAIKRCQTRSVTYSHKSLSTLFDRLGWSHQIIPPATMIVQFQKTFDDYDCAIKGRKELEEGLRLVHRRVAYRLESITRS
jgi:hypothetical protein